MNIGKSKRVIYTSIFGGYDELVEPEFKPVGWDFVCFTDRDFTSETWEIRKSIPLYSDNTRNARKHKLLTHRLFPDYDYSLWVDGNIKVRGDINNMLKYLDNCNYATYDHSQNLLDPRGCIYQEANAIFYGGKKTTEKCQNIINDTATVSGAPFECDCRVNLYKHYKDIPDIIKNQVERYRTEGYPQDNGLVVQMEVLRKHNESDVIEAMENHWIELKHNSRREQLSFNYIAWKDKLKFSYIPGDSRDNEFFLNMGTHKGIK